jgi:serine/alanine adding enzyme
MSIEIKTISPSDIAAWDDYVNSHPQATLYHLSGWKNVIEKTYGHKTYFLMAVKNVHDPVSSIQHPVSSIQKIVGILPLIHLKQFLFGNSLISEQL